LQGTSREIVGRFLGAGGNFVDTADVYSNGVSEEITGRALKGVRDAVVLATKVRFPMGEGPNDVGLSRKHVMQGCENSLRRLGTEYSGRMASPHRSSAPARWNNWKTTSARAVGS
jgi:aryl-alcohol dehydrogenase-like predicted oxidoreductase